MLPLLFLLIFIFNKTSHMKILFRLLLASTFLVAFFYEGIAQDNKLRIIMIGAHPDDCDQKSGGTAIQFAKMGYAVKFVAVTNGDAGHQADRGVSLAKRRLAEAKEAGKRDGVTYDVLNNHDGELLPTLAVRLQIIRGLIGVGSMSTWYYALGQLPLADAGALSFTTAIFVTIGAAIWFGEEVGLRRWSAVIVGLIGALIVLKPGSGVLSWPAIAAAASSALWAASLLMSKELAKYDSVTTITFYQPLMILPVAFLGTIPVWVMPSQEVWLCLFGMGCAAAIGNYGYVKAIRIADVSVTMPADYLRLIWMASWGFWVFGEIPGLSTWIGAALIIAAAFFITIREQQLASARARAKIAAATLKETHP